MKRLATQKRYARYRRETVHYGGRYLCTRLGRSMPRPLTTHGSMHLVMRSNRLAPFRGSEGCVQRLLRKFADRHGIRLVNFAIQVNHLHLYVRLSSKEGYKRFIRGVASAIAYTFVRHARKFWDHRPFSRVLRDPVEEGVLDDYVEINKIEAKGYSRRRARKILRERQEEETRKLQARLRQTSG